jgi:hypothetical protein
MIRTPRCPATGAERIRPSTASGVGNGRFAAVERDGDHLTDELSVGRTSATTGLSWDARWAFESVVIDTQRGFPRH